MLKKQPNERKIKQLKYQQKWVQKQDFKVIRGKEKEQKKNKLRRREACHAHIKNKIYY